MMATITEKSARTYRLGEFHRFEAGGSQFLYLVPAGAIFELDQVSAVLINRLSEGEADHDLLISDLAAKGIETADAEELVEEMFNSQAIVAQNFVAEPVQDPPADFPLQTLVMNLTNQCNLSCTYCYEFGEDKVATPEGKAKFMDMETAKTSVNLLLDQSAGRDNVHITFFGGETLMNFPLLKNVVAYANEQAASQGRSIDFSLTTNATLLTPLHHRVPVAEQYRRHRQHGRSAGASR